MFSHCHRELSELRALIEEAWVMEELYKTTWSIMTRQVEIQDIVTLPITALSLETVVKYVL